MEVKSMLPPWGFRGCFIKFHLRYMVYMVENFDLCIARGFVPVRLDNFRGRWQIPWRLWRSIDIFIAWLAIRRLRGVSPKWIVPAGGIRRFRLPSLILWPMDGSSRGITQYWIALSATTFVSYSSKIRGERQMKKYCRIPYSHCRHGSWNALPRWRQ